MRETESGRAIPLRTHRAIRRIAASLPECARLVRCHVRASGAQPETRHAADPDPKTLAIIRESNRFDTELYEFASNLFDRRLVETCPDLQSELAAFRAENEGRRD